MIFILLGEQEAANQTDYCYINIMPGSALRRFDNLFLGLNEIFNDTGKRERMQ
jgi:hypothetical protein